MQNEAIPEHIKKGLLKLSRQDESQALLTEIIEQAYLLNQIMTEYEVIETLLSRYSKIIEKESKCYSGWIGKNNTLKIF
jgi:hypothetical protein